MASLPTACFLLCLLAIVAFCVSCNGKEISCYYITPDPETSCGEDHEPCLTPDQFASNNTNESATLILIPGDHTLYRNIEIVGVDHFSILAKTNVTIQCASPASFLFEDISNLEITNTAVVSCGGGGSSGALQVRSVQQFDFSNVTPQESAGVSLNVQYSNGLVTGARFIGNTGTGMNIAKSTVVFEGNNTFSDNLDGGIASYYSTLEFIGVNQFTNNTATSGGGISAISSTINFRGNMTFEFNSAEQGGGGLYARGTRMTSEGHIRFIGNTVIEYYIIDSTESYGVGGGLYATVDSIVDFNAECDFINNSAGLGGGVGSVFNTAVNINADSNFIDNTAVAGGGVDAYQATVNISRESNFINNSAQLAGGGVYAGNGTTVYLSGTSNFMYNSAQWGGGVCARIDTTVFLNGTSNFMYNSAQRDGGGVFAGDAAKLYISGSSNFMYNSAQRYGGAFLLQQSEVHISDNSSFTMNSASLRGGGMCLQTNSIAYIRDSVFSDNWSMYGGGISILQSEIVLQGNTVFSNNSASYGGAIQALDAKINITGNDSFTQNLATVNGGALALAEGSVVYLIFETASLTFVENIATSFGGAIFVEDSSVHCSYDWNVNGFIGFYGPTEYECDYLFDLPWCFNSEFSSFKDKINISFSSNSAMAGSAIFGGEIDETVSNIRFYYYEFEEYPTIGDLFNYLININIDDTNSGSSISSTPNHVCRCINGQPDCSDPHSPYEVSVYPGQTVGVSLVSVGQRNGMVPSTITAQYVSDDGATFRDFQSTQTSNPTCTELYYTIFSQK